MGGFPGTWHLGLQSGKPFHLLILCRLECSGPLGGLTCHLLGRWVHTGVRWSLAPPTGRPLGGGVHQASLSHRGREESMCGRNHQKSTPEVSNFMELGFQKVVTDSECLMI